MKEEAGRASKTVTAALLVLAGLGWTSGGVQAHCFPALQHFLHDYITHYAYTEVHIVLRSPDDVNLKLTGRRLLRHTTTTFYKFITPDGLQKHLGPPAHLQRPQHKPPDHHKPLYVATLASVLALPLNLTAQVWQASRSVSWLLLTTTLDPLLDTPGHFLPLDNKVSVGKWSGAGVVEVWEGYQAAPHLPLRTARVGHWFLPPSSPGCSSEVTATPPSQGRGQENSFPGEHFETRRKDLTGLHLRCFTETWQPFTDNQPDDALGVRIGGFMGESFEVMRTLLNFTYTCRRSPDGQFGDVEDGKWTGLVGELVAGRADVVVASIDTTYQRSKVVDFCYPSGSAGYLMVIKMPERDKWSNYTRQMRPSTWAVLVAFVVLGPLLYHLLARFSPLLLSSSLADSWFIIQSLMVSQGSIEGSGAAGRVYLLTVVLTSWLILVFYNSVLVSSLAVPLFRPPFTDMKGLLKAKTHNLGLQKGNSEVEKFRTSRDPLMEEAWKLVKGTPENLVPTFEMGVQKVLEEPFVFLTEASYFSYHMGGDCRFYRVGEQVYKTSFGMAVQKDSPLYSIFNHQVFLQHVTGILDRSLTNFRPRHSHCNLETTGSLDIDSVVTAFLLLLAVVVLAGIILFLEKITFKYFRYNKQISVKSRFHSNCQSTAGVCKHHVKKF